MRCHDGNTLRSAFVLEPSLQDYVNSNTHRYGHPTLAPLRQFLFQIRRSSMQHSNLPCHCLALKKRSYHIIAAGLVSEFQTGNSSFTLQKWSCEVWSWIIKLSANSYIAVPSKTLFEMIRQVWLIKKRSRSHPSGCSVPEVRKSKVFQAVRPVNFPKLKKAKVFQAVQLGNFPACQPLQLRLRSISSIA